MPCLICFEIFIYFIQIILFFNIFQLIIFFINLIWSLSFRKIWIYLLTLIEIMINLKSVYIITCNWIKIIESFWRLLLFRRWLEKLWSYWPCVHRLEKLCFWGRLFFLSSKKIFILKADIFRTSIFIFLIVINWHISWRILYFLILIYCISFFTLIIYCISFFTLI